MRRKTAQRAELKHSFEAFIAHFSGIKNTVFPPAGIPAARERARRVASRSDASRGPLPSEACPDGPPADEWLWG